MRKQIRLLLENIFNDIYDIDQENNSSVEIADDIFIYKVGDIYYKNKEPYAICCGDSDSFKDNKQRFCLFNNVSDRLLWNLKRKEIKELKCYDTSYFVIVDKLQYRNDIIHIDENGYLNTQIIKNKYDLNNFPAFKYCADLGDNVYLPAIDELEYFFFNLVNNNKLNKYLHLFQPRSFCNDYWSSTQQSKVDAHHITIYRDGFNIRLGFESKGHRQNRRVPGYCLPFLYMN